MPGANGSSVKDQIGLRFVYIVEPERVLDADTISAVPLICEDLRKPIHNGSMILSYRSHSHYLAVQKFSPVVLGQDSRFGELIKLGDTEFLTLGLDRHLKKSFIYLTKLFHQRQERLPRT
jgi:hypothetical protein